MLAGLLSLGWLILPPGAAAAAAFTPFAFHSHPLTRVPASPARSPSSHGPASSPEADQGTTSSNWSGYALKGSSGSFTSISGCWTVPMVSSSSGDTFSSAWIGIDGDNNAYLIQTGTEQDWYDGAADYLAWWEILTPSSTVPATEIGVVNRGDAMCASILEEAGGSWAISLSDETTDKQFSTVQPYAGPGESAEWILEAPYVCDPSCVPSTLADYGTATFDGTVNGRDPGLTSSESVAMVQESAQVSTPSDPNAVEDGFSVAYGSIPPSPPPSPSPPAVDSVSPDLGSSGGGRTVTISGGGFAPGAVVAFGSTPATGVTFTNSSELTAVTPPGTGTVAVTVTNLNGGATTDPSAYTYAQDVEAAVRGVGGGTWVLEGLDSMSPVLTGPWSDQGEGSWNRQRWSRCPTRPARAPRSMWLQGSTITSG